MKKNMKRLDNQGVTLVELLISVLILGIVTAPLLHSFFTSAATARKSRQFGDATTCAQNLIETIKETHLDTLLTPDGLRDSLGAGAVFCVPDDEGGYKATESGLAEKADSHYYIWVPGISSGSSSFDALITLDASHELNSEPVTQYTELIAPNMPPGFAPDDAARMELESLSSGTANFIEGSESLQRSITIKVESGTSIGGGTVRIPVHISYLYTGAFQTENEETGEIETHSFSWTPPECPIIADYYAPADALGGEEPAFSVYFFFDSFYANGGKDTVYIDNRHNAVGGRDLCFNLFLVRQKTPETSQSNEITYNPKIIQYENFGLVRDFDKPEFVSACKVYTNMDVNLANGQPLLTEAEKESFYEVYIDYFHFYNETAEPKLVVSDVFDRLLYVNVKLYEAGAGAGSKALISMDATKLD